MALLITVLLGTAAVLLGLWVLILAGWWLTLRLIDPLLERSRTAVQQERILRHHQAIAQQRQAMARQRERQRRRVVDLDGQVRWLLPEEIQAFQRRCWSELELAEGSSWAVVRQHWRRNSLRWHPDHGGDPAIWLRKQRAYGALDSARAQPGRARPAAAEPRQIGGRRRPWPWPWPRPRRG